MISPARWENFKNNGAVGEAYKVGEELEWKFWAVSNCGKFHGYMRRPHDEDDGRLVTEQDLDGQMLFRVVWYPPVPVPWSPGRPDFWAQGQLWLCMLNGIPPDAKWLLEYKFPFWRHHHDGRKVSTCRVKPVTRVLEWMLPI